METRPDKEARVLTMPYGGSCLFYLRKEPEERWTTDGATKGLWYGCCGGEENPECTGVLVSNQA